MGRRIGGGGRVAVRGSDGERGGERRKERIRQMRMSFFCLNKKKKHSHTHRVGGRRRSDDEADATAGGGNYMCEQPVVASPLPP